MKIRYLLAFLAFLAINPAFSNDMPEPEPFVCDGEAYTVRANPGEFFLIDQSMSPFQFLQIGGILTLGDDEIQVNNIGYRLVDNLIYGVALESPTVFNKNLGLVQIDAAGNVFPVSTNPEIADINKRFLAGDIDTDLDVMYLNSYPTEPTMYVVDLATLDSEAVNIAPTTKVNVADWAVNPENGKLYGADGLCKSEADPFAHIYELDVDLNTNSGVVTDLGKVDGLPCVPPPPPPIPPSDRDAQYYGGAWFNAQGKLFVYRNNDNIYEIDLSTSPPTLDSTQAGGAGSSQFNDATACAAGVPIVDKFYTFTNNNFDLRCDEYGENCRLPNVDMDDDIFADPLAQNEEGKYILLGKELKNQNKTVVTPGGYIAVSNITVPIEQDVWIKEDFSDCVGIDTEMKALGYVNPPNVPGGVQVVITYGNGDVEQIDGQLANGNGGSIELNLDEGYALVHVEDLAVDSVLRVMVKFKPNDELGIIGLMCTNHEIALDEDMEEIASDSAGLVIEEK